MSKAPDSSSGPRETAGFKSPTSDKTIFRKESCLSLH